MTIPKNNLVREASIPHGLWSSVWSLNFKYKWRDPYFSLRKKKKKKSERQNCFLFVKGLSICSSLSLTTRGNIPDPRAHRSPQKAYVTSRTTKTRPRTPAYLVLQH